MSTCRIARTSRPTCTVMVIFCECSGGSKGHVLVVGEQQLERVFAGGQRQRGLRLTLAEMQHLVGRRERRIELEVAQVRIDQQVVMARSCRT